jgi:hypothetical protein
MRIGFSITNTPFDEWEEIYMDLISDNVCKYVIQKGISRGCYCLRPIKFKDKLYSYNNRYVHLCYEHKFIVNSDKYYKKKKVKTIPTRCKKKLKVM